MIKTYLVLIIASRLSRFIVSWRKNVLSLSRSRDTKKNIVLVFEQNRILCKVQIMQKMILNIVKIRKKFQSFISWVINDLKSR